MIVSTHGVRRTWRVFGTAILATLPMRALHAQSNLPSSTTELMQRVRDGYARKDTAVFVSNVCWGTHADSAQRAMFDRDVADDFPLKVAQTSIVPLKPDAKLEYTVSGVIYRPTLPPIGRLVVSFETSGLSERGTAFLVGQLDATHTCLVVAQPVSGTRSDR